MRIETAHHVFELDEPAGREGRALFRRASAIIAECDWQPPTQADPGALDRFIFRVAGHSQGEAILMATLGQGGTMDGEPFTVAALDKLPITHSKEPWDALMEAWILLGFFGDPLLKAYRKGAEVLAAAKAEIPASE